MGIVLVLRAFAAGCSALTGVEAITNGVPAFRHPGVRRAQRTEVSLGVLLGVMLIGLAVLIRVHHLVPRGDVTILAQLSAAAFGTGWPFYVTNLAALVSFLSKFTEGAWSLLLIIPGLVWLFGGIESYYRRVGLALGIGQLPPRPAVTAAGQAVGRAGITIVPVVAVTRLAALALETAGR